MEAVIFDMDGVLIDSQPISQAMMRKCAGANGIPLDDDDYRAWAGLSGQMFWEAMVRKHRLPNPVDFYRQDFDVEEEIRRYEGMEPIPGVKSLISALRQHNTSLGLATSGSRRRMMAVLELFDLQSVFSATVSASDVAHAKPHPDVFLEAAAQLGASPALCVVIEDTPHGITAAHRAGMRCVGYRGHAHQDHDLSTADLIVDRFDELDPLRLRSIWP